MKVVMATTPEQYFKWRNSNLLNRFDELALTLR